MRIAFFVLTAIFLINSALPAAALIGFDKDSVNESFFETPQVANPRLNKRVTFSFNDAKLSDILLVLSRQADFNIVLPDKYNSRLTVQINDQKIIDAIGDIMRLTGLSYHFKSNTLIVTSEDAKGQFFSSIPIVYYDAEDLVTVLNDILFEQLIIAQEPDRIEPHAFLDPAKNSIIVFGDKDQVDAAKKFIEKQDAVPMVKIYKPEFVNQDDVQQIIDLYLNRRHSLEIKPYKDQAIVLKGKAEEVVPLIDLIERYDHSPEPVKLVLEISAVSSPVLDFFKAKNQRFKTTESYLLTQEEIDADEYMGLYDYLENIALEAFELSRYQAKNILGIEFEGERQLFDTTQYKLKFFDKEYSPMTEDLYLVRLMGAQGLRAYPKIKELIGSDQAEMVLIVLRAAK